MRLWLMRITTHTNWYCQQGNPRQCGKANHTMWWPTNNAMQTMQAAPPDDQILNQSKLWHLMAKYATNTSGAIWWSNLQLLQVVPSCATLLLMQHYIPVWCGPVLAGFILQLMQVAPTSGNVSFSNPENDPLRTSFFLGMSSLNRTAMIVYEYPADI